MLKKVFDAEELFQELMKDSPDGVPWHRVMCQSPTGIKDWLLKVGDGIWTIYDDLPSLANERARELIEDAIRQEIEVRKEGHPLLTLVRKKRYLAASPVNMLELARELIRWSKRSDKKLH